MKYLLLLLLPFLAHAEPPVIWNGDFAFNLAPTGYEQNSGKQLRDCGAVIPSAGAGVAAPVGSVCQYASGGVGTFYVKIGTADTDWVDALTGATGWSVLGNTGTTPGTNFLGTTDAQDLQIKTDNTLRLTIESDGGANFANNQSNITVADVFGINNSLTVDGTSTISQNVVGEGTYVVVSDDTAITQGASASNSFVTLEDDAVAAGATGVGAGVVLSDNAEVDDAVGVSSNVSINDSVVVNTEAVGVRASVESTVSVPKAIGLDINLNNATTPLGEKYAIRSNGGGMNINYNETFTTDPGFWQSYFIGGTLTVPAGSPISAYGFGVNMAQVLDVQEDWTADGGNLGFNAVGFLGALSISAGKTMYSWTGVLGGAGNPSGSGVLSNGYMFKAAGIAPQGGSVTVGDLYGFYSMPSLCSVASNCWTVFDDADSENYLSKLAIGTSTNKVANSSTALEIGSVKGFINGRGTTVQKNALTAVAGMQFYDTDLDELQWYDGAGWVTASGGGITELTGDVTAGPGSGSQAATIAANAVTDAKFRQSAALSVVGRSANSTGNVADIAAGADYNILRRSGTSIGFGSIDLSQAGAVGTSVLAVPNGGTGAATFTANLPLIGNGTGAIAQGTRSGNTTTFGTTSGALTNGNCAEFDANGNIVDAGAACGGGGSGAFDDNARYSIMTNSWVTRRLVGSQGGVGTANGLTDAYLTDTIGGTSTGETYDGGSKAYNSFSAATTLEQTTVSAQDISNSGNCYVDRTLAIPNGVVVSELGMFQSNSGSVNMYVVERTGANTYVVQASLTYSHSGGGSFQYTALGSPYAVPGSGDFFVAGCTAISTSKFSNNNYLRAQKSSTSLTGTETMTDGTGVVIIMGTKYGSGSDMTLIRSDYTAVASPTDGWITVFVNPIDSITLNTDLTAEITSDGGSNWDAVTLVSKGSYVDGANTYNIYAGKVTLTGASTDMNYRVKTLNSKQIAIAGTALLWE